MFESLMGMVDRGADIRVLSQFPHEEEILYPPLTGIEVLDTYVDGVVLVIKVKLSVNMMSLTLEQVVSKRRKVVSDMKDQIGFTIYPKFSSHGEGEVSILSS